VHESFADDVAAVMRLDAVPTILDTVCQTTGMGFAAVARVSEHRWVACSVRDDIGFGLLPGGELPIETTICDEIRDHREPVVIPDVAVDPVYCGHPTPARYGFRSYISVPILHADGRFFGTLCAIDPEPRDLARPEVQGMFRMFAQLIGVQLDQADLLDAQIAAAEALRESEARQRQIIDSATDYAIVATDIAGRITRWNEGARRIFGWTTAEMLGETAERFFTPEDRADDRMTHEMRAARDTGRGSDERWHMRKDGTRFWASGAMMPLRTAAGVLDGYIEVLRDRTEERLSTETLRSGQANIRLLLDSMVEGFYAVDRDGVTTVCNRAFLEMMGFAREEDAIGLKLHGVIHHSHPDGRDYDVADCPIYTCARDGTPAHVPEELFFPVDGRPPLPVEYWAIPILRDGVLDGAICTFLDLTQRKAANAARSRVEAQLRTLNADLERKVVARSLERGMAWQVSQDLLAVLDRDGVIESSNPAWQRVLGWNADELAAAPVSGFVHDDDAAALRAHLDALRGGDAVVRFENRYRTADDGYRWLSWVLVPETNRIYARARDVTLEKRQAAELADRTAERDRLWRTSQDLLVVIDAQGVFKDVSPVATRILGWSPKEMIGCTVFDFLHPDDLPGGGEVLLEAAQHELPSYVNRYRHKDGSYRWLSWVAAPDGDLIFATARHITAQKEAEDALRQAEDALRQSQKVEAIGQLTGGVAHDFNNLLTVIRGSVDLLRRPDISAERRKRYLDAIADTSDRAVKLTSQLLAFARRSSLKPETFDAGAGLHALHDMIGTLTGSMIAVEIVVDGPCHIVADPSQFDTAIVNMAVNARDAMDRQGRLTIAVRPADAIPAIRNHPRIAGDFVAVSIGDTGSGIDETAIEHIFEPFFTTKGVGQGTGLGLSQVFGFAKQSGGEIVVESRIGEGTVFTLFLPRVAAPAASAKPSARDGSTQVRGACILVVEDNADVGAFATQALADLGHFTVLAGDAEQALARLATGEQTFDAVFTDVVMPGMSGIDLGRAARRLYPGLPVLLTSGYSSVLAEEGTHGFDLLQKPYSVDDLSAALDRLLAAPRNPSSTLPSVDR
jgi:PAS domain S-box-containing protein